MKLQIFKQDLIARKIFLEHRIQNSCKVLCGRSFGQGQADFNLHLAKRAVSEFELDWLWSGDDVAGKENMIMSPEDWREIIKPRLQEIFDVGKSNGLWMAHHCCGALRSIIPDLIEMGLDVLNPIQCDCVGMNPAELKRDFGKDLAFMGGVDTIELLPNATSIPHRDPQQDPTPGH